MPKDIKTHKVISNTIKFKQSTIKAIDRSMRAGADIKHTSEGVADFSTASQKNSTADYVEEGEKTGAGKMLKASDKASKQSIKQLKNNPIKNLRKDVINFGEAKQQVKSAFKDVKTVASEGHKQVSSSIKTANRNIKAAKAASSASKNGMVASYNASKVVFRETAEAAKLSVKALGSAAKATVVFVSKGVEAVTTFIASGGWIAALIVLALVVIILIAVLLLSPFGVTFSNEAVGEKTLSSVQIELNQEFHDRLNLEKAKLAGYDQVIVRPAPMITNWSSIVATYAVRCQSEDLVPVQLDDKGAELLRQTLFDSISFTTSTETVNSIEIDEDTGEEISVTKTYGIVNISYLTVDELSTKYHFSKTDKETLLAIIEMATDMDGIHFGVSTGLLINPCPDGRFNGNDYPAYASSGNYHAGRDIACPVGTPIYAAADGVVTHINDQAATYGLHIMIAHGDEVYTLYAHCSEILVSVGQEVRQGDLIALSGNTGNTTGPHLHFEVRVGGDKYRVNNVDPLEWIGQ